MSEKGSPILLILAALCFVYWASFPTSPDPTQCDLPDSSALIETMREASETLESSRVPEADFGNVDPQPSPSDKPHEKAKREILVFVSANCPPCEKWKRCEMQRFMDAGWAVGIVDQHSYGLTPTFEIESGDKKATIKGYTTLEQASEAVR
jgi:hypothetical protein